MEKHRTKDGSDKKEDLANARVLYSDIMECFKIFKEKTGGILHRHVNIEANANTRDLIAKNCDQFSYRIWGMPVQTKTGTKEKEVCIYTYYGKDYTEKELKKHGGVYIDDPIKFDTILELVPYFPYIVTMSYNDKDKRVIYISNESFAEREHRQHLQAGFDSRTIDYYRKKLAQTYFEICRDYLCYKLDERTKIIKLDRDKLTETESDYRLMIPEGIDENHAVEYFWVDGVSRAHQGSPKRLDKYTITINKQDVDTFLAEAIKEGNVKIKYVEYCEFPLHLG